jgi:hypothetical protein
MVVSVERSSNKLKKENYMRNLIGQTSLNDLAVLPIKDKNW